MLFSLILVVFYNFYFTFLLPLELIRFYKKQIYSRVQIVRIFFMKKNTHFILLPLVLTLLLIFSSVACAQADGSRLSGPDLDTVLFIDKPPLTEKEILSVIDLLPKIVDGNLTKNGFKILAEENGLTPERLNYVLVKIIFGLSLNEKPEARDSLIQITGTIDPLPTDDELQIITKHLTELQIAASSSAK
jgi:hypothetical protein